MIPRGAEAPRDIERPTVAPDGRADAGQPKWRQDFPINVAQDEYVARRDLVKFIVLTSVAMVVGQVSILIRSWFFRDSATAPRVPVATVGELPVGGAKTFTYPAGSTPRLLIRTSATGFVAYDQQCTHLQCPVVPAVAQGRLHCPCHNGWFDLETGRPVAGPPQRALPRITLDVSGGTIYATGIVEERQA